MTRSIKVLLIANVVMSALLMLAVTMWGETSASWFGIGWPLSKPWTLISYMFTQSSAIDLIFNMLWLWCFARIFLEVSGSGHLLRAYFAGGIGGALGFIMAKLAGLHSGLLFGSSAAVLGVIACAAAIAPRMRFNLIFFGPIEIRWIAIIAVTLSLITFAIGNPGGAIAHIGGALGGYVAGFVLKRRRFRLFRPQNISAPSCDLYSLLDKVKRSGYASLTPAERKQLLDISKKL